MIASIRQRMKNESSARTTTTLQEMYEKNYVGLLNLIDQKYGKKIPGTKIQVPSGQAELARRRITPSLPQ